MSSGSIVVEYVVIVSLPAPTQAELQTYILNYLRSIGCYTTCDLGNLIGVSVQGRLNHLVIHLYINTLFIRFEHLL